MPGVDTPPSDRHGSSTPTTEENDVVSEDEARDVEPFLDLSKSPFLFTSSLVELSEEETQRVDGNQSRDLQGCGQLETKWILWHDFMKEHADLDAWLRLAEQAVTSANITCLTYLSAKEELRKFERVRVEAGSRLVQLDSLTRRNRTLTRLFQGVMQTRLLASAKDCGRRWDDVSAKLESITGRLKLFVSEWEGFEAEREELALWLADLNVRLTEVDQLNGSSCEKLQQLQRGEVLIQRSELTDAQHVESRLLDLLRHCSHIYNNIARTHTRLLSMRLVFEDDWILAQATDSGCPSEALLDEEGALDKSNLDLPTVSVIPQDPLQPLHHPPPPPSPSSHTYEHLGLEWDPSVDIGRSVSRDDTDSSYFSASTGVCHRDGLKRWSYLSSLGSQSDISNAIMNHEANSPEQWQEHDCPLTTQEKALLSRDQRPPPSHDAHVGELVLFNGGRVRAWLGEQGPAPSERRTSCSKAVQTDGEVECNLDGSHMYKPNQLHPQLSSDQHQHLFPAASPSLSHDLEASSDWMSHQYQSDLQAEEEPSYEELEPAPSEQSVTSSSRASTSQLSPAILYLLLGAALALLACVVLIALEPPCHRRSRMQHSFHLALRYINGPPPT
ncbi:uncharacterized protein LOC113123808 isoform X2 [Mastacembelus armatus]|uniref:uncharacterized protein LOC113123808 isoform X2 n=1 Tax=Mastacembelus armatus TaxID=205130 RepID=UPI000E459E2D|nr:uncharacterized protein LOC113123808 isoform X2 [Mastacembelus armatus]